MHVLDSNDMGFSKTYLKILLTLFNLGYYYGNFFKNEIRN